MGTDSERRAAEELAARIDLLELTLLEVVTALGLLVGELAGRDDLALSQPAVVEQALESGWQTLIGRVPHAPGRQADAAWSDPHELQQVGPPALLRAMGDTGAATGAIYAVWPERREATLVAFAGYPPGVIDQFRVVALDSDLPVAAAARSRHPIWFAERGDILGRYPDLRAAHEQTEEALGRAGVQGAVVPVVAQGRVAAVVVVGFTLESASASSDRLRAVQERIVRVLTGESPD